MTDFLKENDIKPETRVETTLVHVNTNFSKFCDKVDTENGEELVFLVDFNNTFENWHSNGDDDSGPILVRSRTTLNRNDDAQDMCRDTNQYYQRFYFYANIVNIPGIMLSNWNMTTQYLGLTKPYFIRTYQYDASDRFGYRMSLVKNSSENYLDPEVKRTDEYLFQGRKVWNGFDHHWDFKNTFMLKTNFQIYNLTDFLSFIGGLWTTLSIVFGSIIFALLRRNFWLSLSEKMIMHE